MKQLILGEILHIILKQTNLNVLKQVQIFENKKILKYGEQNLEDQYGFLTDQPLEIENFDDNEISEIENLPIIASATITAVAITVPKMRNLLKDIGFKFISNRQRRRACKTE